LRLSYSIESAGKTAKKFPPEDLPGNAAQKSIRVLKQFDLAGLPSGHYTLRVEVDDLARGKADSQEAQFDVQ